MYLFSRPFGAAALAVLLSATTASAAVIDLLGTEEFNDGDTAILTPFEANVNGDPGPFNVFFGDDNTGNFGRLRYQHSFGGIGGATSASIRIGLYDHDSVNPGDDMIDIYFDGILQDTTMWEGISSVPASHHIRTMDVDLSLLLDGLLFVEIFATDAPSGFTGNGIGVDFSELSVEMSDVPLPAGGVLLLGGLGLLAARRRFG